MITTLEQGRKVMSEILKGVNDIANLVKATMGGRGRYILIKKKTEETRATKDGVTVADSVFVTSTPYGIGVDLIQKAARNTVDAVGDGTTLATVLTQSLINGTAKYLNRGYDPVLLKKEMKKVHADIKYFIETGTNAVDDEDTLVNIATISANNDGHLGELIGTTLWGLGEYGDIKVERSFTPTHNVEFISGYSIPSGYLSPNFINVIKSQDVRYENCLVAIYNKPIYTFDELEDVCGYAANKKQPLLIVAHGYDPHVLRILELNNKEGYAFVAIQVPTLADQRKAVLDDIAKLSKAAVLPSRDITMDKHALGTFGSVHVKKHETILYEGSEDSTEVQAYADAMLKELEGCDDFYIAETLKERYSKLSKGYAILRVGGETEFEISEIFDRVEDSIKATKAAIKGGYVAGGGLTLYKAAEAVGWNVKGRYMKAAVAIFKEALVYPMQTILKNGGVRVGDVINNLNYKGFYDGTLLPKFFNKGFMYFKNPEFFRLHRDYADYKVFSGNTSDFASIYGSNIGYDVVEDRYGDMQEMGIIDPADVIISALDSAVSVTEVFMTAEGVIYENESDPTLPSLKPNFKYY